MSPPIYVGAIRVEVTPTTAPDGRQSVLLQVAEEWYLGMSPTSARELAAMLDDTADEIDPQP